MKKGFFSAFGKKNIIFAAVASILVAVTVVGNSLSWIEEVSEVTFSSENGQQTPLHVGSKVLKSDAVITNNPNDMKVQTISLADYFYASGDMHLSPCYSDGNDFYFPVQGTTDNNMTYYRKGTKDDANVNYLSATFRVKSEAANTVYWLEKTNNTDFVTFTNSGGQNAALQDQLRLSITVDGNTTVYAYNSDGKYKTVDTSGATPKTVVGDGRQLNKYIYYTEQLNNSNPVGYYKNAVNVTNKPNQGAGNNLNGNTLFSVNAYDGEGKKGVKEVTVKLWLEYLNEEQGSFNDGVDIRLSSINLNLVSSWEKTRRIYVKDATVAQKGYGGTAKWLTYNNAKLYWGLKDKPSVNWQLTRVSSSSDYYYVDVPAVYNNADVVLFRTPSSGINSNSNNATAYAAGGSTVYYWDKWETNFPNTFHSETYTVYSKEFGTWDESANCIYFINSAFNFNTNDTDDTRNNQVPYDYMWDSKSVYNESDINGKVVKNADWPGLEMKTELVATTNSQSLPVYAFFFGADYDRIIFNDGHLISGKNDEYQTQDLWLTSDQMNKTFDMSTLTWFNTRPGASDWNTKIPSYSSNNTYLYGNFSTNNRWRKTRFAWGGEYANTEGNAFNGSSSTHMLCKIYCKAGDNYEFKVCYNGNWYGAYKDGDKRVTPNANYYINNTLIPNNYAIQNDDNHQENFIMTGINKGDFIRIYLDTNEMKLYFAKGEN